MRRALSIQMLAVICWASFSWAISFGLGSQVTTFWLHHAGASNRVIGLNHALYYLGLALAALLVPRLMRRWGAACAVAGLVVSGASLALFPWAGGTTGWFACRFVNGLASALSLVPLETLVSRESSDDQRTRNFGFYAVALTLGGAAGIWLGLHFFEPGETLPFLLGSMVPLAAAPVLWYKLECLGTQPEGGPATGAPLHWRRNFLGFATGWCQGFLEGGMLAFLSLYLVARGFSADTAGSLMSVTMVGVILLQVPASWLADRLGRMPVLLACYGLVLAGLVLVPWCAGTVWVGIWLFVLGASSGALYPLGLALLGGREGDALVRAYAWLLALECLGSQMGAAAMGLARDGWGEASMFGVGFAAVGLLLLAALLLHLSRPRQQRSPCRADHQSTSQAA